VSIPEIHRLHLDQPLAGAVLGFGGDLKCAVALGKGRDVLVYEPVGDVAEPANQDRLEAHVRALLKAHGRDVAALACDLHPGYFSSKLCRRIADETGLRRVEVQHHRAHVAATAAEHGLASAPLVGLAFDGTGYGDDGVIWGGEFFSGSVSGRMERRGSFAPLTLCGGDAAVRAPWRMALAFMIENGFDSPKIEAWARQVGVRLPDLDLFRRALHLGLQCSKTTALGRWFDCFSALWGVCAEVEFEAQAAIELQRAAESYDGGCFLGPCTVRWLDDRLAVITFEEFLETLDYMVVDWSPRHAAAFARQFHASVAESVAEVAARLAREAGTDVVCCGGGCFLNGLLCAMLDKQFSRFGLRRVQPRALPPGDQSLAVGQVLLADQALRQAGAECPRGLRA